MYSYLYYEDLIILSILIIVLFIIYQRRRMDKMKLKDCKLNWQKIISIFVMLSLIAAIIFLVIELVIAPSKNSLEPYKRVKSDYVLMLVQCCLGVIAMLLPGILKKKLKIEVPSNMIILYTLFLYCAIYLGEVRSFYYEIREWDTILHAFSGAMLGALGFSFISFLNGVEKVPLNLSPLFVAIFSFCFAVTLGVFWEVYEFTFDGLLGLNMQKFALENGQPLIGHKALRDTMEDLMVDCVGAFIISVIGYISLKYKKGLIDKFLLKIKK